MDTKTTKINARKYSVIAVSSLDYLFAFAFIVLMLGAVWWDVVHISVVSSLLDQWYQAIIFTL